MALKILTFTEKKEAIFNLLQERDATITDISTSLLLHPESVRTAVQHLVAEEKVRPLDDGWQTKYSSKTQGRIIRLTDTRHNEGGTIGMRSDPIHRRTIGQMI
ncbi:hypothetical protein LIN78_02040 [Leeia sp. TBRC 13508]|uniref:Uncharacterized protein n=1 Tax=Leeia speluncae TaxID=2884804 RepID=A0ABS8D2W7_9NEIS|nr:hypothetical protein [Leeia speluncae]MCB6182336.1 hypothetical protein [Leeia speluncae]